MRYSAADKAEIIQLVENSALSVRQTLVRLDIHKSTFYNWLKRYEEGGINGLEDKLSIPQAVWNKIAEEHREAIIELALDKPDLSPRELAVHYTENKYYFPGELEEELQGFVSYYNHERYHESLNNLTPADVFYGRGQEILNQRELIKQSTLATRRQIHYDRQQTIN